MSDSDSAVRHWIASGYPEPIEVQQALSRVESRLFHRESGPTKLSRYVLLKRIGSGGGGIVYVAYDSELEREVAIKVLHHRRARGHANGHARLLREAQTLARISHANVVAVHDVASYAVQELSSWRSEPVEPSDGCGVFVVMDYVRGQTLGQWARASDRHWRERLDVLLAAGRGLAAAHASGVVHRDFKPSNVLIGDDGRVLVSDFGLATAQGQSDSEVDGGRSTVVPHRRPSRAHRDRDRMAAAAEPIPSSGAVWMRLTHGGAVLGTPEFMAPEQHRGEVADTHTDQYSFCATAFEILFGQPAFDGRSPDRLLELKLAGIVRPSDRHGVPSRVERAILRGLEPEPTQRHPSLAVLLDELERGARQRRQQVVAGAVAGVVGLVGVLAVVMHGQHQARAQACEQQANLIDDAWGDATRRAGQAAFLATEVPYATSVWESVAATLDGYAQRWSTMRSEVCLEVALAPAPRREQLQRRAACLDRDLDRFGALSELFTNANTRIVERATHATAALPALDACLDDDRLAAEFGHRAGATGSAVGHVAATGLARAHNLLEAGEYARGRVLLDGMLGAEATHELVPMRAPALLLRGRIRAAQGDALGAEQDLFAAQLAAERVGDSETAVLSLAYMIPVKSSLLGRYDDAERSAEQAAAKLEHHRGSPQTEAALAYELGRLRVLQGRPESARRHLLDALDLVLTYAHSDAPIARVRTQLGKALHKSGDFAGAARQYELAQEIWQRLAGPHHPGFGELLHRRSVTAVRRHKLDEALEHAERSREILIAAFGQGHPQVVRAVDQIGRILGAQGRVEESLAFHQQAVRATRTLHSSDHPELARVVHNLGRRLLQLGRTDEALAHLEEAMSIWRAQPTPVGTSLAHALTSIGLVYVAREEWSWALPPLREALELRERAYGCDHHKTIETVVPLVSAYAANGERQQAFALLDRVEGELGPRPDAPRERAALTFARAQLVLEDDPVQALALAAVGETLYLQAGRAQLEADEVAAWMRAHDPLGAHGE